MHQSHRHFHCRKGVRVKSSKLPSLDDLCVSKPSPSSLFSDLLALYVSFSTVFNMNSCLANVIQCSFRHRLGFLSPKVVVRGFSWKLVFYRCFLLKYFPFHLAGESPLSSLSMKSKEKSEKKVLRNFWEHLSMFWFAKRRNGHSKRKKKRMRSSRRQSEPPIRASSDSATSSEEGHSKVLGKGLLQNILSIT